MQSNTIILRSSITLGFMHFADLKARNVLLKSSGSEGRGLLAKVGDSGTCRQGL